jgi:hypothetical protein
MGLKPFKDRNSLKQSNNKMNNYFYHLILTIMEIPKKEKNLIKQKFLTSIKTMII